LGGKKRAEAEFLREGKEKEASGTVWNRVSGLALLRNSVIRAKLEGFEGYKRGEAQRKKKKAVAKVGGDSLGFKSHVRKEREKESQERKGEGRSGRTQRALLKEERCPRQKKRAPTR